MDISAENLSFAYDYSLYPALEKISFTVKKGEFIAVLGANGSGKSTLARHLNALIPSEKGRLSVLGLDTSDRGNYEKLRRNCGMVFQNPDNQFVCGTVEEDVAFGPENYEEKNIEERVKNALSAVGMTGFEKKSPHLLSGGQKQRVAVAGVISLDPQIVVFDEVTSMLDPEGREEVLSYIEKIRRQGRTVIMITHFTDEAVNADRIFIMHRGKIIKEGAPRQVLSDRETLKKACLTPPFAADVYFRLLDKGVRLPFFPLTEKELAEEICSLK